MKALKTVAIILSVFLLISFAVNIKLITFVLQNYNTVKMGINFVNYISDEVGFNLPSSKDTTDIFIVDDRDWWFGEGTSAAVIGLNSSENEKFLNFVESNDARWEKLSDMSDYLKTHLFGDETDDGYLNKGISRSESGYYCIYDKCNSNFNESNIFDKCWSFIYIEYIPTDSKIYIHDYDD